MKTKYFYLLLAGLISILAACKKTIYPDPLPQNKILEYKVVNIQDTVIYGAVDNIENTITVYIPYYYGLTVIQPKITLDANATLTTSAEPVSIDNTSQTYTVRGGDGTTRTYKLNIVQQNTANLTLNWFESDPRAIPNGQLTLISGNFLSTSTATLKVTLTNPATNKTVLGDLSTAQIVANGDNYGDTYILAIKVPLDIDSGRYNVQVDYLGHSVKMNKPLRVYYNVPAIATTFNTQTVAAGDSISFLNQNNVFIDLKSVKATISGQAYDFPIQTSTRTKIVIKVPEGLPVGSWGYTPFSFQFGNWQPVVTNVPLVVKVKTGG
jgi:hypothetical protein